MWAGATLHLSDCVVLTVGLGCIESSRWAENLTATPHSSVDWTEITAFSLSYGAQESASFLVSPLNFGPGKLNL